MRTMRACVTDEGSETIHMAGWSRALAPHRWGADGEKTWRPGGSQAGEGAEYVNATNIGSVGPPGGGRRRSRPSGVCPLPDLTIGSRYRSVSRVTRLSAPGPALGVARSSPHTRARTPTRTEGEARLARAAHPASDPFNVLLKRIDYSNGRGHIGVAHSRTRQRHSTGIKSKIQTPVRRRARRDRSP